MYIIHSKVGKSPDDVIEKGFQLTLARNVLNESCDLISQVTCDMPAMLMSSLGLEPDNRPLMSDFSSHKQRDRNLQTN